MPEQLSMFGRSVCVTLTLDQYKETVERRHALQIIAAALADHDLPDYKIVELARSVIAGTQL